MQSHQTNSLLPIHLRGRKPVQFTMAEPGTVVIRVRKEARITKDKKRVWLGVSKPLPAYRHLANQLLNGDLGDVEYRVLPARPHSLRLLWRACRDYVNGNYVSASILIEKALDALLFEDKRGCWDGDRIHVFNLLYGIREAQIKTADEASVVAHWEAEADWWTGGQWPGSGLFSRLMDRWAEAQLRIAREEQAAARARQRERTKTKVQRYLEARAAAPDER